MVRKVCYKEDEDNHERWVISYADFVTLLFAFFVVMYSVSSVNEGKYKVLTETLEEVFSNTHKQLLPHAIGEHKANQVGGSEKMIKLPKPGDFNADENYQFSIEGDDQNKTGGVGYDESFDINHNGLKSITENIRKNIKGLVNEENISIHTNDLWVEVEIKSSILFASGEAEPGFEARRILLKIADVLRHYPNPIHVEGFTDDVPIENNRFPSNWELSSARASAIVRLLIRGQVDPRRLASVGYAEYQPVSSNDTEDGRRKNRRVVLVISRDLNVRKSLNSVGVQNAEQKQMLFKKLHNDLNDQLNLGKTISSDVNKESAELKKSENLSDSSALEF